MGCKGLGCKGLGYKEPGHKGLEKLLLPSLGTATAAGALQIPVLTPRAHGAPAQHGVRMRHRNGTRLGDAGSVPSRHWDGVLGVLPVSLSSCQVKSLGRNLCASHNLSFPLRALWPGVRPGTTSKRRVFNNLEPWKGSAPTPAVFGFLLMQDAFPHLFPINSTWEYLGALRPSFSHTLPRLQ